jgi:hypothetical protein
VANYTLTSNLKLRIESTLSPNSKYNLERIDTLGGSLLPDNTDTIRIRSRGPIALLPNNADIGGTGSGGLLTFGDPNQLAETITLWGTAVQFPTGLYLKSLSETNYLRLTYASGVITLDDEVGSQSVTINTQAGDRVLTLGSDLALVGFPLTLTTTGPSSVILPLAGTLATLTGTETLTGKTIDASANTILNITNSSIASTAAIAYSKLALAGSLVNADISPSAAIAYSKLALASSILDADIAPSAAIAKTKLALAGTINDNDISVTAAIAGSKVVPWFGNQIVRTQAGVEFSNGVYTTTVVQATSGQVGNVTFKLPPNAGTPGQVLSTDGTGELAWSNVSAVSGSVNSYEDIWAPGDGLVKVVTHPLSTTSVDVTIRDQGTGELIMVNSILVIGSSSVQLTSSEVPPANWRVTIQG